MLRLEMSLLKLINNSSQSKSIRWRTFGNRRKILHKLGQLYSPWFSRKVLVPQIWINLDHAFSEANWSHRKWRIWGTKMADNQHFQYINKLPYFKEILRKVKTLVKKLILTPAKDTGPGVPRWRRWASKFDYWNYCDAWSRFIHISDWYVKTLAWRTSFDFKTLEVR